MGAPASSSLGPRESESGSLSPVGRDTEIRELLRDGGWEPIGACGSHRTVLHPCFYLSHLVIWCVSGEHPRDWLYLGLGLQQQMVGAK